MGTLLLHAGMHKTGSSSIQETLFRALADPRFHYVDLGASNASREVVTAFSATPETQNANRRRGLDRGQLLLEAARLRERLAAQLAEAFAGGRTAILSGEHIPLLAQAELEDLVAFLGRSGVSSIRTAVYVRPPLGFIESVFQQHVQGGRARFEPAREFPRYSRRLGRLEAALGASPPEYWLFEPARFPDGCVVADFCARTGIAMEPAAIHRVNESLSLPALRLLYALRRFGPAVARGDAPMRADRQLVERLREIPGPRLRIHDSLTAPLMREFEAEIAWMEARLGESLRAEPRRLGEECLRNEGDLLRFEPAELGWLAEALALPASHTAGWRGDPVAVGRAMDALRAREAGVARPGPLARVAAALRRRFRPPREASGPPA